MSQEENAGRVSIPLQRELEARKQKPTETGLWLYRCAETDNEWQSIIITISKDGLLVNCRYLGFTRLDDFHDGLTGIEWRRPQ